MRLIRTGEGFQYFDEYGQATGGGYYTLKAYLPAVTITSYNLTSTEAIQEFVDSLNAFSITEMKSITRGLRCSHEPIKQSEKIISVPLHAAHRLVEFAKNPC